MSAPRIDPFGISDHFHDIFGERRDTSAATRRALREAMGEGEPPEEEGVRVLRLGDSALERLRGELELEQGGALRLDGRPLPPGLPPGYHWLQPPDGPRVRLILAPRRCWLPAERRSWGWAVQLYALRSAGSWGTGDLRDLRRLAEWSRGLGAGLLLVNPLLAVAPVADPQDSPYYPSSRCFRNPLYLCIEEVPGAERLGAELEALSRAGQALNARDRIDRSAVHQLKLRALERIWEGFGGDAGFERFCQEQGQPLVSFASYCVLVERHGPDWRRWPEELRDARSPAVARAVGAHSGRLDFFRWLQWLIDEQLARASREIAHLHDLPIGVDPGGADAWIWRTELARGASVGAPPDLYAAQGQDWGLPPFIPYRLRAAAYEPFVRTLRASLRHAGGLRIDHVMGLFRLFWIPEGRSPAEGAYVYYPSEELLAITALESQRAGALIVGEDLGTVEPGTREKLAAHDILSYRLLWFEERPPAEYPELALAAVTTHDLPTVAGLWSGSDLEEQRALGLAVNEEETRRVRARLAEMTGLDDGAPLDAVIEAAYRLLAAAPCRLLTATLEDLVAAERRPNLPATTREQRPNWSLALGRTLEELMRAPLAERVAAALRRGCPPA